MLKGIVIVVAVALIFGLAGCGQGKPAAPAAAPAPTPAETSKPDTGASSKAKKPKSSGPEIVPGAETDKDKEITTKLMADGGRWIETSKDEDGNEVESLVIFLPAKVLNIKTGDERVSGTWEVRDGYLIYSIGDLKSVDKIKEVTDKEFIYTDSETQQSVIARKLKD